MATGSSWQPPENFPTVTARYFDGFSGLYTIEFDDGVRLTFERDELRDPNDAQEFNDFIITRYLEAARPDPGFEAFCQEENEL